MLKNKMKKILCGVAICVTVCSQVIFPQAVFAATKKAVEKAGEEFVAAMEARKMWIQMFLLRRVWITQKLRKRHRVDQQRKN